MNGRAVGHHGTPAAWRRYGGGALAAAGALAGTAMVWVLLGALPVQVATGLWCGALLLAGFGVHALFRPRR
ncbi:hypothetical protein [Coralloluteibacterium thermophilus]|uniref:Uncharacterized protein n=1 Tax=Coralloluteibacterium thermophilum TaxID=2707049 RepID=A0ABV9NMT8_9GAMM